MILTPEYYLNLGLPISDDVDHNEIEAAVTVIEEVIVKPRLGDDNLNDLEDYNNLPAEQQDPTDEEYILLNGGRMQSGKRYAGLKRAEAYLTYGYMMTNTYRITRYATVEKNSEFSSSARQDMDFQSRTNWEIGQTMLEEIMKYYNIEIDRSLPNILDTLF